MNGYNIFLMVELARIAGIIPKDLEYDLTWEKGEELFDNFRLGEFNDPNKPEYNCIEEFLKDWKRIDDEERERFKSEEEG